MIKEQYILELIKQGKTNEEIEVLVNEKSQEFTYSPAPLPLNPITTQQALDRLVAIITYLNTKANTKIKYYSGEIITFNIEKVSPSKFADTTLFSMFIENTAKFNYIAKKDITFADME